MAGFQDLHFRVMIKTRNRVPLTFLQQYEQDIYEALLKPNIEIFSNKILNYQ